MTREQELARERERLRLLISRQRREIAQHSRRLRAPFRQVAVLRTSAQGLVRGLPLLLPLLALALVLRPAVSLRAGVLMLMAWRSFHMTRGAMTERLLQTLLDAFTLLQAHRSRLRALATPGAA